MFNLVSAAISFRHACLDQFGGHPAVETVLAYERPVSLLVDDRDDVVPSQVHALLQLLLHDEVLGHHDLLALLCVVFMKIR